MSTDFDIFASKPTQSSILGTVETRYKPIAPVDQSDLEFVIPGDNESYVDLDIKLYVRGKLISSTDGKDYDAKEFSCVTNNFLHSLFSECSVTLNGVSITPASDHYNYREYLETLLTYGKDAATSRLTNAMFHLGTGDMLAADPTATATTDTNAGFIARWQRAKHSKELELFGRLHNDLCNVPQLLLPGVNMQIKLTKAKRSFYILAKTKDSKATFRFLDAQLFVHRVRPNPTILLAHANALSTGCIARYHLTRVELKTFTFSSGSQSLSIDNAVLGRLPKRLLFVMVKNEEFLGTVATNPYTFRHYDMTHFVMYVNGRQVPSEGGLSLDMGHEKTSVMGYRTLFTGSGIHHSNTGLLISHDMYIAGYFMLLFDLTPDLSASEPHTSLPENGAIRIELKFKEALKDPVTCLLYLEYDGCVHIDTSRTVTTDY